MIAEWTKDGSRRMARFVLGAVILALAVQACDHVFDLKAGQPARVIITPGTVELDALELDEQLTATVVDATGDTVTGLALTWSSSDETVATVTNTARVTAVGNGTATIRARTSSGASGAVRVTVEQMARGIAFPDPITDARVGQPLDPLTVHVVDRLNHPVESYTATVTLQLMGNPTGAELNGTTTATALAGVAVFDGLSLDRVGSGYVLTAISGALSGDSAPFSVGPAGLGD